MKIWTVLTALLLGVSTLSNADVFDKTKKATVKVTNESERSGGTGTIIRSTKSASIILTNAHVCNVVKNGGKIITSDGERHTVIKYKKSKQHDLCLIMVAIDLGVDMSLASEAPEEGESIAVSGHPFLYPHINMPGHITGKMEVTLITSVEKCTKEEFEKYPFLCLLFGMPVISTYETRVISSMIAPGNSGSGVFDNNGDVVGVVFAGRGRGFTAGIIVPYEYVRGFLRVEARKLAWEKPKTSGKIVDIFKSTDITTKNTTNLRRLSEIKDTDEVVLPALYDQRLDSLSDNLNCSTKENLLCITK